MIFTLCVACLINVQCWRRWRTVMTPWWQFLERFIGFSLMLSSLCLQEKCPPDRCWWFQFIAWSATVTTQTSAACPGLICDLDACRFAAWFPLDRAMSLSAYRWRSDTDHAAVLVTCQTVGCLFRLIYDLEPCRLAVCFHLDRATSLTAPTWRSPTSRDLETLIVYNHVYVCFQAHNSNAAQYIQRECVIFIHYKMYFNRLLNICAMQWSVPTLSSYCAPSSDLQEKHR